MDPYPIYTSLSSCSESSIHHCDSSTEPHLSCLLLPLHLSKDNAIASRRPTISKPNQSSPAPVIATIVRRAQALLSRSQFSLSQEKSTPAILLNNLLSLPMTRQAVKSPVARPVTPCFGSFSLNSWKAWYSFEAARSLKPISTSIFKPTSLPEASFLGSQFLRGFSTLKRTSLRTLASSVKRVWHV